MLKLTHYCILLLSLCLCSLAYITYGSQANEATTLLRFLHTKRSNSFGQTENFHELNEDELQSSVNIMSQGGLQQLDKIRALPGQPDVAQFAQYSGYVTVDQVAGKALFYYFVESPRNSSTNPLLLWLNGGPGCSSFGYGAMEELGPFRVNRDGKTLFQNEYTWSNVANVIFLESPAGVGFSYSNTTANYNQTGDKSTAHDAYTFIVNWLQRFPQYKTRDFYIAGESYAGHYVPQLAYTILVNNKKAKQPTVNLKGIAIGNGLLNDATDFFGRFDYAWTHALISDETYEGIRKNCDFVKENYPEKCQEFLLKRSKETGVIDYYNIYAPVCHDTATQRDLSNTVQKIDPCIDNYVMAYLNTPEVQKALHVEPTKWSSCSSVIRKWIDSTDTMLPVIKQLMDAGIRVWIYSGDIDSVLPVTGTRYSINTLELPIQSAWRPWYTNNEIGGYVVEYKGMVFVTVRGAGHMVPSDQPERALTMISSFFEGVLPPSF